MKWEAIVAVAVGACVLMTTSAHAGPGPDIEITALSPPLAASAGDVITVDNTVANTGNTDAASTVSVGIYLLDQDRAVDLVADVSSIVGSWTTAQPLTKRNGTHDQESDSTSVTIPGGTTPGVYYIIAYGDNKTPAPGDVNEGADEDNNQRSQSIVIDQFPDYEITAVSGPAAAAAGDTITVGNTVENTGSYNGPQGFYVGIYLSGDSTIDLGDRLLAEWQIANGLSAGVNSADNTSVDLPPDIVTGDYYVGAYADNRQEALEEDESNNGNAAALSSPISITGVTPSEPPVTFLGGGCVPGAPASASALLLPVALAAGVLALMRGGRARARCAASLLATAILLCGCAGLPAFDTTVEVDDGYLAAAAPDILAASRALPAHLPGDLRKGYVGARAGVLIPTAAQDEAYSASFTLGAFYPGELRGLFGVPAIPFEAGFDLAWVESDGGAVDASLLLVRFDCLFSKWAGKGLKPEMYFLGGYQLISVANEVSAGSDKAEIDSALDLGGGMVWVTQGVDVRLTYSILLGSDNVGGILSLTGAYVF